MGSAEARALDDLATAVHQYAGVLLGDPAVVDAFLGGFEAALAAAAVLEGGGGGGS